MRGTQTFGGGNQYKSGDVLTLPYNMSASGYLTSNKTEVDFAIPLPQIAPTDLSATLSGRIFSRGTSGQYSLNNVDVNNFGGTLRVYNGGSYLRVQLTGLDATGISDTNNTAMSIMLVAGFTITFN